MKEYIGIIEKAFEEKGLIAQSKDVVETGGRFETTYFLEPKDPDVKSHLKTASGRQGKGESAISISVCLFFGSSGATKDSLHLQAFKAFVEQSTKKRNVHFDQKDAEKKIGAAISQFLLSIFKEAKEASDKIMESENLFARIEEIGLKTQSKAHKPYVDIGGTLTNTETKKKVSLLKTKSGGFELHFPPGSVSEDDALALLEQAANSLSSKA